MPTIPLPKPVPRPVTAPESNALPPPVEKAKRTRKPKTVVLPVDVPFAVVSGSGKVLPAPKSTKLAYSVFLGVDPGTSGGVVALDAKGRILLMEKIPTIVVQKTTKTKLGNFRTSTEVDFNKFAELINKLKALVQDGSGILLTLETASPRPGEGGIYVWAFAGGYFCWKTAAGMAGIPLQQIHPSSWKKDMFGGRIKVEGVNVKKGKQLKLIKDMSIRKCGELFPGKLPASFNDHNLADALLIAEWGRRNAGRS